MRIHPARRHVRPRMDGWPVSNNKGPACNVQRVKSDVPSLEGNISLQGARCTQACRAPRHRMKRAMAWPGAPPVGGPRDRYRMNAAARHPHLDVRLASSSAPHRSPLRHRVARSRLRCLPRRMSLRHAPCRSPRRPPRRLPLRVAPCSPLPRSPGLAAVPGTARCRVWSYFPIQGSAPPPPPKSAMRRRSA